MEKIKFTKELTDAGWLVKELPIDQPIRPGQQQVAFNPAPPPQPVVLADISYDLACQVVKNNGMFVVPLEFLSDEAKEQMLEIDNAELSANEKPILLPEAEIIKLIKTAPNMEAITAAMGNNTAKRVIKAAEDRAAELMEGQKK